MHTRRAFASLPSLLQSTGMRMRAGRNAVQHPVSVSGQVQSRRLGLYAGGGVNRSVSRMPVAMQVRALHRTRPLNAVPALSFIGLWVAKKAIVLIASYLYGFKRLYGRLLRFHDRQFPARVQPYTKWALRHTFDAAIKLVSLVDFRARKRVVAAGVEIPTDAPPVVYPPKESFHDLKQVAEKPLRKKEMTNKADK